MFYKPPPHVTPLLLCKPLPHVTCEMFYKSHPHVTALLFYKPLPRVTSSLFIFHHHVTPIFCFITYSLMSSTPLLIYKPVPHITPLLSFTLQHYFITGNKMPSAIHLTVTYTEKV